MIRPVEALVEAAAKAEKIHLPGGVSGVLAATIKSILSDLIRAELISAARVELDSLSLSRISTG
jgi:hypothetical protein